ncbi:MAG: nucleotidyltransferase domain-containing protein, partial [Gammaproteobacteria bacterium]|nr:nucleotidyltransferase domain-containing protein [Gammaproteobacteria bacterium]
MPNLGIFIPNMGTVRNRQPAGLAAALFTPVQARVLGLVFGQPDRQFQSAELIRLAEGGTGAVHRQLTRLADAGLVIVTHRGNQKYYQANAESPVYVELHGLVVKSVGLVEPLRRALARHASKIQAAFIFGSVAKGTDRATSDIDLFILSDSLRHDQAF